MSLLQTVKPVSSQHGPETFAYLDTKTGNKTVSPIDQTQPIQDSLPLYHQQPDPVEVGFQPTIFDGRVEAGTPNPAHQPGYVDSSQPVTDAPATPANTTQVPQFSGSGLRVDSADVTRNTAQTGDYSGVNQPGVNATTDAADVARSEAQTGNYSDVNQPTVGAYNVRDNASVAGNLTALLSDDNPYIKQARQQAAEVAASRGLRNSSMGAQAGQQAAISAALPIAQQDASQNFQLQQNEQGQQYALDQNLYNALLSGERDRVMQEYGLDNRQYDAALQQARDQNQQQYALDQNMYNALLTGERDRVMQEYGLDSRQYDAALQQARDQNQQGFETDRMQYQTQLQQVLSSQEHQQTLERMDSSHRQGLESMQQGFINELERMGVVMEHDTRMAYTQATTNMMNTAMDQMGLIYSNPNMSPEQQSQAVNRLMREMQSFGQGIASVFNPLPGIDFVPGEEPTQPAPTQPAPTQPAPTQPAPTQPAPTQPAPTQPNDVVQPNYTRPAEEQQR